MGKTASDSLLLWRPLNCIGEGVVMKGRKCNNEVAKLRALIELRKGFILVQYLQY
jgi:hypothetical protein